MIAGKAQQQPDLACALAREVVAIEEENDTSEAQTQSYSGSLKGYIWTPETMT